VVRRESLFTPTCRISFFLEQNTSLILSYLRSQALNCKIRRNNSRLQALKDQQLSVKRHSADLATGRHQFCKERSARSARRPVAVLRNHGSKGNVYDSCPRPLGYEIGSDRKMLAGMEEESAEGSCGVQLSRIEYVISIRKVK
jgi:hypothetical protein